MKYRRDIDGLRAVAVIPVVLYHAGVSGFSGGFVGVDVFFVISGYLITRLIWREIQNGHFSLMTFYERRARRILPALFVVMAFSAFAAYHLFLSSDLRDFSNSLVAATAFIANFHFLGDIDYFAAPAEVKPLLHTWSLAIEEQFYIIYPLLLLGLWRFYSRRLVPLLMGALLLSLGWSIWMVGHSQDAAFYLPQTRVWELLLGCLLALGVMPTVRSARVSAGISAAGLGMILAAVFAYDHSTPFPGMAALLPCLGAAMIIWAGDARTTAVNRLISTPVFVGIGLISYSLYLWHWPLIVFTKYYLVRPLLAWEIVAVVGVSFVLAALSWRYVEKPFRGISSRVAKTQIARWATMGGSAFLVFGLLGHQTLGFAHREDFARLKFTDFVAPGDCIQEHALEWARSGEKCWLGAKKSTQPDFIVWGDSHAAPLFPVFDALARQFGKSGVSVGKPGCRPLIQLESLDTNRKCQVFNADVLEFVREHNIRTILLASRWNLILGKPEPELRTEGHEVYFGDSETIHISLSENLMAFGRTAVQTFDTLRSEGRQVWMVLQAPYVGRHVPQFLSRRYSEPEELRIALEEGITRHQRMKGIISPIAEQYGVKLLDPVPVLCEGQLCLIAKAGQPIYKDDDHLSKHGGFMLEALLASAFSEQRIDLVKSIPSSKLTANEMPRELVQP